MIRFAGHLPFFKIATAAMLPQAIGLGGVVVTAFVYSLLCLLVTRHFGARHSPFAATLVLIAAMMVVGPAIALALPAEPLPANHTGLSGLMLPYLGVLLPVCLGFFAVQFMVGHHCRTQVASLRLRTQENRK